MSSCFSGAGRAYGFDFEIVKSPSSSTRTSHTSSPSSTISESSNSPLAISTRKPRTPRKRPNQTYNEAAILLSTVYPKIFSPNHLTKPRKSTNPPIFFPQSSDLLISDFLLDQTPPEKHSFRFEPKAGSCYEKRCQSPGEVEFPGNKVAELSEGFGDDFDAESILDEEIEEGIDSILGNLNVAADETNSSCITSQINHSNYGINALGLGFGGKFDFGFGIRRGVRAFRGVDEGNYWWSFPTVDIGEISPKFNKVSNSADKKKKKVEKPVAERKNSDSPKEKSLQKPNSGLLLKLNYDKVLDAWSDRGSPFPEEVSDCPGNDFHARLAQIDLFSESGGLREASVLRYKEKRRTRLFSKKIRYQVRKVNADRRPRMKGRFVRRPNSSAKGHHDEKIGCRDGGK